MMKKIKKVSIKYETTDYPPPYSYHYQLDCELQEENLKVSLDLQYTDRDLIDEDEIYAEGFSLNDDYFWKGILPEVWLRAFQDFLGSVSLAQKSDTESLFVKIQYDNDQKKEGFPEDIRKWEYFLQELIQAVYETDRKELPLKIRFLKHKTSGDDTLYDFNVFFARRDILLKELNNKREYKISWEEGKNLLKQIYMLDFLEGSDKKPADEGHFIDPGDGYWYKLGKDAVNPHVTNNAVEKIQNFFSKQ